MPEIILQIDDEPGISSALMVRLRAAGYQVLTASDGPAGLRAAATHAPSAILLDIRMPGMDGFEVCRRLKDDPALKEIPVVLLSADMTDTARASAESAGGAAHVSKPYEARDVMETLRRVIASRSFPEAPHEIS